MRKKNLSKSHTTWYFSEGGDRPVGAWHRHVGPNKKIHILESKKKFVFPEE
jgi:hypothetical protein